MYVAVIISISYMWVDLQKPTKNATTKILFKIIIEL